MLFSKSSFVNKWQNLYLFKYIMLSSTWVHILTLFMRHAFLEPVAYKRSLLWTYHLLVTWLCVVYRSVQTCMHALIATAFCSSASHVRLMCRRANLLSSARGLLFPLHSTRKPRTPTSPWLHRALYPWRPARTIWNTISMCRNHFQKQ